MGRQRLDKWLWHARVVKTRPDAAELVAKGRVRVNGNREKSPGHAIKIGDVLTIALDSRVRVMKVADFCDGVAMPPPVLRFTTICNPLMNDYLPANTGVASLAAPHVLRYPKP